MALRFMIEIDDQGRVNLEGPLGNKLLCYGILQAGMDAVREFKPAQQPRVQVVHGHLPPANGPAS